MSSKERLRSIEPLRLHGHTLAEVFVSRIGLPHSLAMTFDTEDDGEASVTLTAREATDLMLWLQCALQQSETEARPMHKRLRAVAMELSRISGEHPRLANDGTLAVWASRLLDLSMHMELGAAEETKPPPLHTPYDGHIHQGAEDASGVYVCHICGWRDE